MCDADPGLVVDQANLRTTNDAVVVTKVALQKINHRLIDLVTVHLLRAIKDRRKQIASSTDSDNGGTPERAPSPICNMLRASSPRRVRLDRQWNAPHKCTC